ESPAAMLNLHKDAQDLSLDELEKTITEVPAANPAMNSYAVEYYALLAKPFICLLIVGLAVPLAVAGVRTNALAGASQAIGWFFAYYVVAGMCTHLGNLHYLPAIVAAWLPLTAMFGVSLWLFRKAA
ncbi:MAG TPA: LptF/LptG family permease, partial [Opitutales bacterium]|nr:LptF/LptG family permease [Opitutales bacterium]